MSTTPDNWERLLSPVYCSNCGEDISVDRCNCIKEYELESDIDECVEDVYRDIELY